MADFDAQQPVRAIPTEFATEVANSTGTIINPVEEFAQGSTTAGQNGALVQAAVTTSAPTYSTGTTNPLSMDTAGNLRVTVVSLPVSDENVNIDKFGGTSVTLGQKVMASSMPVVIASDQSTLNTKDAADGSTGSAVPSTAILAGGDVVSSPPTLVAGNLASLYLTTAGRLIVDGSQVTQPVSGTVTANQGTANATPWNENVAQWGGSATSLGQKVMASSVPVVIASDQSSIPVTSTPIAGHNPDYKHASAIAAGSSDTHIFSPSSTINLDRITCSASGAWKAQIQWGTTGSEVEYATLFGTASEQDHDLVLPYPIQITNTMSIKVIVTNREPLTAQDLYSTILYH